jgi:hypothetical protein
VTTALTLSSWLNWTGLLEASRAVLRFLDQVGEGHNEKGRSQAITQRLIRWAFGPPATGGAAKFAVG